MRTQFGPKALADYQLAALLTLIQNVVPEVTSIQSQYLHFIDGDVRTPVQEDNLQSLLSYGEIFEDASQDTHLFLVIPRIGTISPWASKATDILNNCGVSSIERIERGIAYHIEAPTLHSDEKAQISALLHDRMVETVLHSLEDASQVFSKTEPAHLTYIPVDTEGAAALVSANKNLGLALTDDEIEYLVKSFTELGRNPTDAELMMFSVVNSEHCRHKVFNATWKIDGVSQPKSLFKMIKNTFESHSDGVKSAYHDNGAVIAGNEGEFFFPDQSRTYRPTPSPVDIVIKVETHNHPTAIAPIPGASTGSGGEIRDEGATGRGARPKAGLTGFSVSDLAIPENAKPWEIDYGKPDRLVSSLQVMLDGPIGGAAFNNEFGRPNLAGYFRSFQQASHLTSSSSSAPSLSSSSSAPSPSSCTPEEMQDLHVWGYHKPIMIAGGLGVIDPASVEKGKIEKGDKLVVLGGPAMLIGLGGGAASSVASGSQDSELDFASVQRHNPEMQRRCQEVINTCWRLGAAENPIVSIHDVGAGGISNALPEIVHDSELGAVIELREVPNSDLSMSPMQIWSNESQERYVLAIKPDDVERFTEICERERCPFAVVGSATGESHLMLTDSLLGDNAVDISMDVLFGKPPKMERSFSPTSVDLPEFDSEGIELDDAVDRVLSHPTVASKAFLIYIGDRSVGGMTARDQLVGPWQVPVADVAVTHNSFTGFAGEAMAMGERSPVAVVDAPASGRLAVGEAITNLMSADIEKLSDIKLSANWMVSVSSAGQDEALFETVKSLGESFCPELGLTIPVGKDSTSMKAHWNDDGTDKSVVSPLSVVITGFAPVTDVRKTVTPQLVNHRDTQLMLLPVNSGTELGGSILAQVFNKSASTVPDVTSGGLKSFVDAVIDLKKQGLVLAYHDRSDGGLFASLVEMAFAGNAGIDIDIETDDALGELFSEGLGAVIQVKPTDVEKVKSIYPSSKVVGRVNGTTQVKVSNNGGTLYNKSLVDLKKIWSTTSYQMQRLRDNPECADQEFESITSDTGLDPHITFRVSAPNRTDDNKTLRVAVLREQGVNGQVEMAAAFTAAGFECVDVHMSDLRNGTVDLNNFVGLAAAGGFSYGDVLGAGAGWAKSILFDENLKAQMKTFFERSNTFTLGVCNGCQMVSHLKDLIPGAQHWPKFVKNKSQQFEARLSTLEITESPSIFFKGMEGSRLMVPLAHGEGQADFSSGSKTEAISSARFVDNKGQPTEMYPFNPNGSPDGLNAFTTTDGRATILMPHPERAFRTSQLSWHPDNWSSKSPWMQMFYNAYEWTIES